MEDSKKSKRKIRILELVIFCLLIIVVRLIYISFVQERNLHKVLNDRVNVESNKTDAETYANKQYQENVELRKKINKLQTENNINAVTTALPNYTKLIEKNLGKIFKNFYKIEDNFSVQRSIINRQVASVQPFFENEFDGLKEYRSVVDSINFSYQIFEDKLLTTMIVETTQFKDKSKTINNSAPKKIHFWKFFFNLQNMKITKVITAFSANLLTTDK